MDTLCAAGVGQSTIPNVQDGLCKLPLFRPVATKILQLTGREDVEIGQLTALIQTDPALSADILLVSNSSLYGFASNIRSVSHAVTVLGLERTQALTLTIAMRCYLKNTLHTPAVSNSWKHSLACALLAHELAPLYGTQSDPAHTAGLMHDIGRLGLLAAYPKDYAPLLSATYEQMADVWQAEQRLFEMDHCKAGAWLTKVWGFPAELREITAGHHDAPLQGRHDIVSLVRLACLAADALGFAAVQCNNCPNLEEIRLELEPAQRARFHLSFGEVRERIQNKIKLLM